MRIDIVSLFPSMFKGPFDESIIKRAIDKRIVEINLHNLRDFAIDKRGTVDNHPFGGGVGMVLRPEPIFSTVENIKKLTANLPRRSTDEGGQPKTILLSASGVPYTQQKAVEFSKLSQLILICGHYEGVDQRVANHLADEEITIGDYILTGGEIPAMVIIDSVIRLLPGVLKKTDATKLESFSTYSPSEESLRATSEVLAKSDSSEVKLLEHPHYTRPQNFKEYKVPEVLLSGNHQEIEKWRQQKSLEKTRKFRPDLLRK